MTLRDKPNTLVLRDFLVGVASSASADWTGSGPAFDALKRVRTRKSPMFGQAVGFLLAVSGIAWTVWMAAADSPWTEAGALAVLGLVVSANVGAALFCRRVPATPTVADARSPVVERLMAAWRRGPEAMRAELDAVEREQGRSRV